MRLLHHDRLQANLWQHLPDDQAPGRSAATVSLKRWLAQRESLTGDYGVCGVRIGPDEALEPLLSDLPRIQLLVIEMSSFSDGRAFSRVRQLRDNLGFAGEIRIRGSFLPDQIHAFLRLGVDSFELPETMDVADALRVARRYSQPYQPDPARHKADLAPGSLVVH